MKLFYPKQKDRKQKGISRWLTDRNKKLQPLLRTGHYILKYYKMVKWPPKKYFKKRRQQLPQPKHGTHSINRDNLRQ